VHPRGRGPHARAAGEAGAQPHPNWGAPLAATLASLPKPLAEWTVEARGEGQQVKLALTPPDGAADPGRAALLPVPGRAHRGVVAADAVARRARVRARAAGRLPARAGIHARRRRDQRAGGIGDAKAATIDVPLAGAVVAGPKPVDAKAPTLVITSAARARR
jgi:hypothetical protein